MDVGDEPLNEGRGRHLKARSDDEYNVIKMIGPIKASKITRQNRKQIPIKAQLLLGVIIVPIVLIGFYFLSKFVQELFPFPRGFQLLFVGIILFPIIFFIVYLASLVIIKKYNLRA